VSHGFPVLHNLTAGPLIPRCRSGRGAALSPDATILLFRLSALTGSKLRGVPRHALPHGILDEFVAAPLPPREPLPELPTPASRPQRNLKERHRKPAEYAPLPTPPPAFTVLKAAESK